MNDQKENDLLENSSDPRVLRQLEGDRFAQTVKKRERILLISVVVVFMLIGLADGIAIYSRYLRPRKPAYLCGLAANISCPNTKPCCSKYDFCGGSRAYCGAGCQSNFSFGGVCIPPLPFLAANLEYPFVPLSN